MRVALLVGVLISAISAGAFAQASSVVLAPLAPFAPNAAPIPTKPLEILDSDYPLESLIQNEEGQTVLNLVLSDTGAVRVAQIIGSSGSPALDGRAAQVARTRWSFQPVVKDGAPTSAEVTVAVTWKLPLIPRDDYAMDAPRPAATSVVIPPTIKSGGGIRLDRDYPAVSIRLQEMGEPIVKFLISETGRVSEPTILLSSGSARLDEAAIRMVQRRTYNPAIVDGTPKALANTAFISFYLRNRGDPSPLFCHDRPVFSTYERFTPPTTGTPNGFAEWLLIGEGSQVEDALLLTRNGWMHVQETALSQMRLPSGQPLVRKRASDRRDCWIHFSEGLPR